MAQSASLLWKQHSRLSSLLRFQLLLYLFFHSILLSVGNNVILSFFKAETSARPLRNGRAHGMLTT